MPSNDFLQDAILLFRKQKELAEKAVAQVEHQHLFTRLDRESNSIANLMKHMAGNMRSRWTDFLTSDGEKPDRHRNSEFIIERGDTKSGLLERWEAGWRSVFSALQPLTPLDLDRSVLIRGEPHTVLQAINRQLTHYSYHVGQIVFLAKHLGSSQWKSLSIPRGKSEEFNRKTKNSESQNPNSK